MLHINFQKDKSECWPKHHQVLQRFCYLKNVEEFREVSSNWVKELGKIVPCSASKVKGTCQHVVIISVQIMVYGSVLYNERFSVSIFVFFNFLSTF